MDVDSVTTPADGHDGEITGVRLRRLWDSRGRPTVEAEVRTSTGATGRAIAPSGASTGSGERLERRDGGARLGGADVTDVVRDAAEVLGDQLPGTPATFAAVDEVLERLDPDRDAPTLGGNVLIAVSMATAWAQAAARGVPLWRFLAGNGAAAAGSAATSSGPWIPLPQIQIIGGGAHAERALDIQDLMVVCPGASTVAEAIEWTNEVYLAVGAILAPRGAHGVADEGGFWPVFASNADALDVLTRGIEAAGFGGDQVAISLDIAATQLCDPSGARYRLGLDDRALDRDEMVGQIVRWCTDFPVVLVEDPLHEGDVAGHAAIRHELAGRTLVVGDDLLVTDPDRVRATAGAADVLLLKPNQAGTLSATARALAAARDVGVSVIASARSGETEDVTIAHVAVGWRAEGVKVGSVTRGERTAKWNELIRIEEEVPLFMAPHPFLPTT